MPRPENLDYRRSFSQVRKEAPRDSSSINHELLIKAGFIKQETAGVFTLLPLGNRVVRNMEEIIREEMNGLGAQELTMPAMHPKENWVKTGRWDVVDVLFKIKSRWGNKEYALGPTHEEIVTPLAKDRIHSYRDLPLAVYQIQTKFRDEKRAKSGIIRGREFGMKDMYSFHSSQEDLLQFYDSVIEAYLSIFRRCGIDAKITEASGGDFTKKFSHEFMAISPAGEDTIVYCPQCTFAQNVEIASVAEGQACPHCSSVLETAKAIEIGNIFDLGRKFTDAFEVSFTDEQGKKQPVYMGCYGIGTTRLLGTVVELHHDAQGIMWPEEIAPYNAHLVVINSDDPEVMAANQVLLAEMNARGMTVMFDDRTEVKAGEKFAIADAIGIPVRVVLSAKTLRNQAVEVKNRSANESVLMTFDEFYENLGPENQPR